MGVLTRIRREIPSFTGFSRSNPLSSKVTKRLGEGKTVHLPASLPRVLRLAGVTRHFGN
jgi:hypothetical protein